MARPVTLKLFSSLLFCLLLLCSKIQQHIFVQNLEPRLFSAFYQQLGWCAHNQAIKKNEKSHFQCMTAYRSCVYIMTYVCHYMPYFTNCPNNKQTTEVFFCFGFVDQAVLFT